MALNFSNANQRFGGKFPESTYQRKPVWADVSTDVKDVTVREAVEKAGLDWSVALEPVFHKVEETGITRFKEVDGRLAVVRSDTKTAIGVVGSRYTPFQNRQVAEFLESVVDEGGIVETAGSLHGGRKVWFLVKTPADILIGGQDRYTPYILAANGHDGGLALHISMVTVRVVCTNTLAMALNSNPREWSVKHTESINGRVTQAREALDLSFKYSEEFTAAMNAFAAHPMSDGAMVDFSERLIPMGDPNKTSEEQRENVAKARLALLATYKASPTVDRGTAYGALNAATEWYDHLRNADKPAYGTKKSKESRLEAIFFGAGQTFKDRAVALLSA